MIVADRTSLRLAVALQDAGWHPAAWREPGAQAGALLTAAAWLGQVHEAQHGAIDFVTLSDAPRLQSSRPDGPDARTDRVRGRLDAVMTAARVAPATQRIGLVPEIATAFTEPFLVSSAIATLDFVSGGRAGWMPRLEATAAQARATGLPVATAADAVLADAAEHVEVVRRLWDSWEDDAVIRDVASSRFLDPSKVHHIDFEGERLRVKGPSITPRSPQGQPLVVVAAADDAALAFAGAHADVVCVTAHDDAALRAVLAAAAPTLRVLVDLVVFLDADAGAAAARKARLDALDGAELTSDALIVCATPAQLADRLAAWHALGAAGFRLRPAAVPHDLRAITRALVPELRRRGLRAGDGGDGGAPTLRGRLGLERPANRFVAA